LPDTTPKRSQPFFSGAARPVRAVSPLTLRILAVNVMALAILVGSILYMGNYQDRIIATELKEMSSQARLVASAVEVNAVVVDNHDQRILSPLLARLIVRRLSEATENRTRIFSASETLLADSRAMLGRSDRMQNNELFSEDEPVSWGARTIAAIFDAIDIIHERRVYPRIMRGTVDRTSPFNVLADALRGEEATQVWSTKRGGLILAAVVPIKHANRILGAVSMSRSDASIDRAIYAVRINILQIFLMTLGITIFLSFYLARAIARPLRQLAHAAEVLRRGQTDQMGISGISNMLYGEVLPDMTSRNDEIGDLSGALRALTAALAKRVGDIENFAADVAHELKNPLTSLRSAVETIERVDDPGTRQKLIPIIRDDVDRMARLITEISYASRLDAELGRAEFASVDIGAILRQMENYYGQSNGEEKPLPIVFQTANVALHVMGVQGRLVQVLQNLLDNALSFSPPDKPVKLIAAREGAYVYITVEDSGPGLPENKLDAVFDRFYSERPKTEKFGTHSGLGLSISKQIVEAHRGRVWAENRKAEDGAIVGAKFVVQIPAIEG